MILLLVMLINAALCKVIDEGKIDLEHPEGDAECGQSISLSWTYDAPGNWSVGDKVVITVARERSGLSNVLVGELKTVEYTEMETVVTIPKPLPTSWLAQGFKNNGDRVKAIFHVHKQGDENVQSECGTFCSDPHVGVACCPEGFLGCACSNNGMCNNAIEHECSAQNVCVARSAVTTPPTPAPSMMPVNCVLSSWSAWSSCSSECSGTGSQSRTRSIQINAAYGGTPCPSAASSQRLETQSCANNCRVCSWTAWGQWASCSVTCGAGSRMRTRTEVSATCGCASCAGSSSDVGVCNLGTCSTTALTQSPGGTATMSTTMKSIPMTTFLNTTVSCTRMQKQVCGSDAICFKNGQCIGRDIAATTKEAIRNESTSFAEQPADTAVIGGFVAGALAAIVVAITVAWCCVLKKRRRAEIIVQPEQQQLQQMDWRQERGTTSSHYASLADGFGLHAADSQHYSSIETIAQEHENAATH